MKKIGLSAFVIVAFILYSFHERQEGSQVKVSIPSVSVPTKSSSQPNSSVVYKDGTYTGKVADAFYGNMQVRATITSGKLSDIEFLQYPNDRDTSIDISKQSMPILKKEAITAQSSQVDIVSGATQTSEAFSQSLKSALDQAKS